MAGLSEHKKHLRRLTVDSPNDPISFPAPAAIFADEVRSYGPVPAFNLLENLADFRYCLSANNLKTSKKILSTKLV
jgi:hypothetical protein